MSFVRSIGEFNETHLNNLRKWIQLWGSQSHGEVGFLLGNDKMMLVINQSLGKILGQTHSSLLLWKCIANFPNLIVKNKEEEKVERMGFANWKVFTYPSGLSPHPCKCSSSSRRRGPATGTSQQGGWRWSRWRRRRPWGPPALPPSPAERWPMPTTALQTRSRPLLYARSP